MHKEMAGNVTGNIDKVRHNKGWITTIFQEFLEFRLIFIILNDENSFAAHTVSRLHNAGANCLGVRQQFCRLNEEKKLYNEIEIQRF